VNKEYLENIFDKAKGKKIFIIGDVMLDRYMLGEVNRISPEAPVQVFDIRKSEYKLGGAANVGLNVKTLGAEPVLIGVTGDDADGIIFNEVMNENKITADGIINEKDRNTTCKTRVIADSHHLLRIDSETKKEISSQSRNNISDFLQSHLDDISIIILQDYNKGVLTKELITEVISFAVKNKIKILVDPKFENFFEYKGAYLFKPNKKELENAFGRILKNDDDLESCITELKEKISCENVVVTLGEQGMRIFEFDSGKPSIESVSTKARKVADVSGAGDTVISTIAVALAGGASLKEAAVISNYAAGLVVEEVGIVPVEKDKLIEHIANEEEKL
jgi:D-glycero-beta-D-manno-heptose-7-phosphate kinase